MFMFVRLAGRPGLRLAAEVPANRKPLAALKIIQGVLMGMTILALLVLGVAVMVREIMREL